MNRIISWLKRLYSKLGHRGIMLTMFFVFFAYHTALALCAYLPSIDPNEFSVAALSALFSGKDWSSAMEQNNYFYGFVQAVFYTPVTFFVSDAFLQYRLMLIMNGALMSLIPVIAYSLSLKIGASKPWQAGLVALCSGGYMTYFAHSKFIWNETVAIFLPWLIVWLVFRTSEKRTKPSKIMYSLLTGFVTALAFGAHQRLIAVILAVILTLVLTNIIFRTKLVSFSAFFGSFAVTSVLQQLCIYALQNVLWKESNPSALFNTAENFFASIGKSLENGGLTRFFQTLIGQIYYFAASSWGIGSLCVVIFVLVITRFIHARVEKRDKPYNMYFMTFLCFATLTALFTLFVSVCYKFGSDMLYTSQDALLFGRYLDAVTPFAVMIVLLYVFMYDLRLTDVFFSVIVQACCYILYYFLAQPVTLGAEATRISPVLALYPLIFNNSGTLLNNYSLAAATSCTMCVFSLFIVIIACGTKKTRSVITAFAMLFITAYTCAYASFYYLPLCFTESENQNRIYVELSEYIYNLEEAPEVTAYKTPRNATQMLQYINQGTTVHYAAEVSQIADNTLVVVPDGEVIRFPTSTKKITFTEIASLGGYKIYAYGERALAYVQSQTK